MKSFAKLTLMMMAMLMYVAVNAQDDPKKGKQDTTKKTGTRMAIGSQGLPSKGGKGQSHKETDHDTKKDDKKDEPAKENPNKPH